MIKPHRRGGRFYNDEHDYSVAVRVKDLLASGLYIAQKKILGIEKRNPFFANAEQQHAWTEQNPISPTHLRPRITWLGHATCLIQLANINILTDPVFGHVSSFFPRMTPLPLDPKNLPNIDVIVLSHNHPDHFDRTSLQQLVAHKPLVLVPLGDKLLLQSLGFTRVHELMWGEQMPISATGLTIHFLPACHWSGMGPLSINKSLWGSWLFDYHGSSIYFAGDTAYSNHFSLIGSYFAPIDVVIMPIGPNTPRTLMSSAHVDAAEAVQAVIDLGARHVIPMHWGTFKCGDDNFIDPVAMLLWWWDEYRATTKHKQLTILPFGGSLTLP